MIPYTWQEIPETPEQKQKRTRSIMEYNLLYRNCKEKWELLNGEFGTVYQYYWFNMLFRPDIAISQREADIGREVAIHNMKNYLGVWKR